MVTFNGQQPTTWIPRYTCKQRPQYSPTKEEVKLGEWGSHEDLHQQVRLRSERSPSVPPDCQSQSWCAHCISSRQFIQCWQWRRRRGSPTTFSHLRCSHSSYCSVHNVIAWGVRLLWSVSSGATNQRRLSALWTFACLFEVCCTVAAMDNGCPLYHSSIDMV